MHASKWALLALSWLSLGGHAAAQHTWTYTVWGQYNSVRVELKIDEAAGVARVRLTNTGKDVVDLGRAPLADAALAPHLYFTQLPFRGIYFTPSLDAPTTKLNPGATLQGNIKLAYPEPADGPYTHWCYTGIATGRDHGDFIRLCQQAGN